MSLRIGTNVAAMAATRDLSRNSEDMQKSLERLSSGSRIVRPGDDSAGFAISEQLRGESRGLQQARRNADNAIGLIQVAEGGLSEQNNIVVRLREIAVQSASDTVSDDEREFLNTEFQSLIAESDRIAESTRFGQKQLLVGKDQNFDFYVGASGDRATDVISYRLDANTRSSALGISGAGVSDKSDAESFLKDVDESLLKLSKTRAGFGAIQGRLEIAGNNLDVQNENVMEARSRIADTDVAAEASNLARTQVLSDLGVAVLAQANQQPARALKLL